jgi:GntR family transcriptional regulator
MMAAKHVVGALRCPVEQMELREQVCSPLLTRGKSALRGQRGDPTPLYYRLANILRAGIDSGEYAAGSSLPTELQLERLYNVSRMTVRKAVGSLVADGLLSRKRGRAGGTFVIGRPKPESREGDVIGPLDRISGPGLVHTIRILAFDLRPCDAETAAVLRIAPQDEIRFVERLVNTDTGPLGYVRNYFPVAIGAQVRRNDLEAKFLRHVLQDTYGVRIGTVRDEIEAHLADSSVAALLRIRAGSPVLRIIRSFFDHRSRCICLTKLIICSKYKMSVTLPEKHR